MSVTIHLSVVNIVQGHNDVNSFLVYKKNNDSKFKNLYVYLLANDDR